MSRVARLAVARPRAALAGWLVVIAALGVLGTGVESRLTQSIFVLPGTETEEAIELAEHTFGESVFVPVLLEGPPRAIDRQGPRLVEAIAAEPGWRALSPWDSGPAARALRPRRNAAMVVASVSGPYEEIFDQTAERIQALVGAEIEPPLEARITGMPVIGHAIKQETYSSARHAERVAAPILIVVLLLVFRAPIAALFPAVVGLTTVLAASGALWLLAGPFPIDPIAISLSSMMGLALGVDYSLLIVSRFREQIAAGETPREAALGAMATAGRTVLFAGGALLAAMAVGIAISPGDILLSAVAGVATSTVISIVSAFIAIPAALALFGAHLDRWRIGTQRDGGPAWLTAMRGALARPGLAAAAVAIPLLVLAAPAFGLNTGPPDVSQLPADDRARLDYERVAEVMGPGWAAPFEIAIVDPDGPITAPDKLAALEGWQREVADSNHVRSVVGPGNIAPASRRAGRAAGVLTGGTEGIGRLVRGIGRARQGARELERAQAAATAAIEELEQGSEAAGSGAEEITRRLEAVAGGTVLIRDAVARLTSGGERLIEALAEGRRGTIRLVRGLDFAIDLVRFQAATAARLIGVDLGIQADEVAELIPRAQSAETNLRAALAALDAMGIGRSDPQYQAARDAVAAALEDVGGNPDPGETETGADIPPILSLARELELAETRLRNTVSDAERLERGMQRLAGRLREAKRGAAALRDGIEEVGGGTDRLRSGALAVGDALGRLHDGVVAIAGGASQLRSGLGDLAGGAAQLAGGFRSGGDRVGALVFGLDRAGEGAGRLHRRTLAIQRSLRGVAELFDSGYFVLAGIEAAPRKRRAQAEVAVNVRSGGEAGRVLVVPTTGPNDEPTRELRDFLSVRTAELADRLGVEAAVGGTAAALAEYDERASGRLVWLILALAAVSYFVLIPVFRSFVLPLLAVALNLISVGAAFGALALLFEGSDPVLGGPGYLDAVSVSAIYTVIFGLSLDYQVFLIHRMREGWQRLGDTRAAISYGLERTAAVVTGAAAIMVAVFVAFALTDIAGTRQFGTGMVIAVILDATLVRLILLPAVMRLTGDACWWWPWARADREPERAA